MRKRIAIILFIILCFSLLWIGISSEEYKKIYKNATKLCFSCIGIK